MAHSQELSATLEDYLEAIGRLSDARRVARARDIAKALSIHKSTVTAALKSLADKGMVNYSPYEAARLTTEGRKVAQRVLSRHKAISGFLEDVLAVKQEVAEANACRIEHGIDRDVFKRLALFMDFVRGHLGSDEVVRRRFRKYLQHVVHPQGRREARKRLEE